MVGHALRKAGVPATLIVTAPRPVAYIPIGLRLQTDGTTGWMIRRTRPESWRSSARRTPQAIHQVLARTSFLGAVSNIEEPYLDIDKFEVEIDCPGCGFGNPILLGQARLRDVVICRGCKSNIQLDDSMNTVRKARQRLRRAFRDLEDTLARLNRR